MSAVSLTMEPTSQKLSSWWLLSKRRNTEQPKVGIGIEAGSSKDLKGKNRDIGFSVTEHGWSGEGLHSNIIDPSSSTVCADWKADRCPRGQNCHYRHGPETTGPGTTTMQQPTHRGQEDNESQQGNDKTRQISEELEAKQPGRRLKEAHRFGMEKLLHEAFRSGGQRHGNVHREVKEEIMETRGKLRNEKTSQIRKQEESVFKQYAVFNEANLVTYGPGLEVRNIVPGFDLCRITIQNLPKFTEAADITDLLVKHGLPISDFHVVSISTSTTANEAIILANKERGQTAASLVDGIELRGEILSTEVGDNLRRHTLRVSEHSINPYLTVDWKIPTNKLIASYRSAEEAEKRRKDLNGMMWKGYRIKAALHESRRTHPTNSIKITNFPPDATSDEEFIEFIGTDSYRISQAKPYDHQQSLSAVYDHLRRQIGVKMDTYEVEPSDNFETTKIKVHFNEWLDVRWAYISVHHRKLGSTTPTPTLRGWYPRPVQYSIKIPRQQYMAQKEHWDALGEIVPGREVYLQTRSGDRGESTFIYLLGNDKVTVGTLKVRVEKLVAGEALGVECWHPTFLSASHRQTKAFLNRVQTATGIYIKSDPEMQTFKVYGDPEKIEDARSMIVAEIKIREVLEASKPIVLDSAAVEPQAHTAAKESREKHFLFQAIEEPPLAGTSKGGRCAVCYNEASNPEQLDCGHSYCAECMQHFLSSAAEAKRFPLLCIGNDARCNKPISIHLVRRFVKTNQAFQNLVEAAFVGFMEQHTQEYRWCATPDCVQVYGRKGQKKALECPSCFLTVCPLCDEVSHEGMTCKERRLQHNPEVIEMRHRQLGYRKCPKCNSWIEKTGGCNHISCRCGSHICWRCMNTFPNSEIYTHIKKGHCKSYTHVTTVTGVSTLPMGRVRRRRLSECLAAQVGQRRRGIVIQPGAVANAEVVDQPRRQRETPGCTVM